MKTAKELKLMIAAAEQLEAAASALTTAHIACVNAANDKSATQAMELAIKASKNFWKKVRQEIMESTPEGIQTDAFYSQLIA